MRRALIVSLVVLLGVVAGSGAFTFVYAEGASYLRDDAEACGNCHVMDEQLRAWGRGSHRVAAVCNDCHAPHDSLFAKLAVKALNGFNHSWAFTTGSYPEVLRITPLNRRVTESACRHCHGAVVSVIEPHAAGTDSGSEELACIRCHEEVGHP